VRNIAFTILTCFLFLFPDAAKSFQLPDYVSKVPKGHFAGISVPCETMAEARQSAIMDVARQILGAVNARYRHSFSSFVSGDPRLPHRSVVDRFCVESSGIVLGIARNIVKCDFTEDHKGRHLCFILCRYSPERTARMRRLSGGAKLTGATLDCSLHDATLQVTEANGVAVFITEADVYFQKQNRYADTISHFIWKVPKKTTGIHPTPFAHPIRICGESRQIRVPLKSCRRLLDYFLGAEFTYTVVLKGYDELSRPVKLKVSF